MTTATLDLKSPWMKTTREKKIQQPDVDALIESGLGPTLLGPDDGAVQAPPKPPETEPKVPKVPPVKPKRVDYDTDEDDPPDAAMARLDAGIAWRQLASLE